MHAFGHALRSMWRQWLKAPGFAIVATITLGLGIGATTAVWSVVDPLLVRQLPVRDPGGLVLLHAAGTLQTIDSLPVAAMPQFAAANGVLESVLATGGVSDHEATFGGHRVTVKGSPVSPNYFDALGARAHLGQLTSAPGVAGTGATVVLSHAAWVQHFGSDPNVVGRVVTIRELPYTVSGVAARGFAGVIAGTEPDVFLPLDSMGQAAWVHLIGRLRDGVSRARALVALDPAFRRVVASTDIPAIEKDQAMARLLVAPANRGVSAARDALGARPWMLLVVVSLALLIACANVAGLVLTRAASRRQQLSVELALGATRGQLARRFLLEGAGVAVLGLVFGLGVAHFGSRLLAAWLSAGPAPVTITPGLDLRLLAFAGGLLCLTVLACGVLPALMATRIDVAQGLRFRAGGLDRGARPSLMRRALIVSQIALSVTLLSTTGLLVHSFVNLRTFDLGYDTSRVLAVTLRDSNTRRTREQADQLVSEITRRARETAGVTAAGFGTLPPLSGSEIGINIVAEPARPRAPAHTFITPGVRSEYFDTLGLRLVAGASCPNPALNPEPSAVINQRLSQALFPGEHAVGQRVRFVEGRRPPMTVVGIAADSTYVSLRETPRNAVYLCWINGQLTRLHNLVLFVRSADASAAPLTGSMRELVRSIDSDLPIHKAQTLEQYRSDSLRPDRLVTGLASAFTLIAVLIAGVGLYGVIAATVIRQTPEIGLRMALGADAARVARFVTVPTLVVAAIGLLLGVAGAAATSSVLSSLLFGLDHVDPVTWAGVTLVLLVICTLALALPVRRALRIDPISALRAE